MRRVISSAISDVREGLRMRPVWVALAQEDIGDQHRRTTLGPLWLVISYLALVGTFVFVINNDDGGSHYLPYVATGLLVWLYIMETLTRSTTLFLREEALIKGTLLPLSVYVLRLMMQSLIRAAYAAVGCLVLLLVSGLSPAPAWIWSVLGVLLILATTPAAIILCAFLGAYFPDSQFIVANAMRLGMFLTPVFWIYDGEGGLRGAVYAWNPFTYFLEIVRTPILSNSFPLGAFMACAGILIGLWAVALILLGRFRKEVALVL